MKPASLAWSIAFVALAACAELLDASFDDVRIEKDAATGDGSDDGSNDGPTEASADSAPDAACMPPIEPISLGPDPGCVATASSEDVATPADDNCDGYLGNHLFSVGIGGSDEQLYPRLVVTPDGNAVIGATFTGSVTLDGKATVAPGGGFLIELDPSGAHVWSKAFGANEPSGTRALGIDRAGNLIYLGVYNSAVDFGTGELHPLGELRQAWASFDAAGAPRWARMLPGFAPGESYELAGAMAGVGLSGGRFAVIVPSTVDVPLEGQTSLLAGTSLVVVDAQGALESVVRWSTLNAVGPNALTVWDAFGGRCDEVFVIGHVTGTTLIGDASRLLPIGVADETRAFIAKFVPAGGGYVVEVAGTLGQVDAFSFVSGALAPDDSIVVAMTAPDIDWGPEPLELGGACGTLAVPGDGDAVVARLDSSLSCVSARLLRPVQAGEYDGVFDVAIDSRGNAIVAYEAQEVINYAGYLVKLDPSFEPIWQRQALSAPVSTYFSQVAIDANDAVFATGSKGTGSDLGGGPIAEPGRLFVAKYAP